jgi:hypothetical protein
VEFAWTQAYHSRDCTPLTQQQVAAIAPETFGMVRLVPHPSLHCIASEYPIFHIWQANQVADTDERISLAEGASHLLVIRPGEEVEVREVSAGEFHFMAQLQSGTTLEVAVAHVQGSGDPFDLTDFLGRHLFDGTFCGIQLAPDAHPRAAGTAELISTPQNNNHEVQL